MRKYREMTELRCEEGISKFPYWYKNTLKMWKIHFPFFNKFILERDDTFPVFITTYHSPIFPTSKKIHIISWKKLDSRTINEIAQFGGQIVQHNLLSLKWFDNDLLYCFLDFHYVTYLSFIQIHQYYRPFLRMFCLAASIVM